MIEFWLSAGLLCLVAVGFLLIPLLRGRKLQAEEDRTALNVTLYQERLRELDLQHQAGTLDDARLQTARDEAARELLADTEGSGEAKPAGRLGRKVPMVMVLSIPLLGILLYTQFGAIDEVQRARTFVGEPRSIEEMTARLEQAVQSNPESPEGWYFLGRSYMAQERPVEAARAFEQAVEVAGREPELLGQWAQALYFAGGKQWTEQLDALTGEALQADPEEVTSLGLLGIAAYEEQRFQDAIGYWERLVAVLPEGDPSRQAIAGGIARARQEIDPQAGGAAAAQTPEIGSLQVRVELADSLRDKVQPGDTVFVFARAASGPPMPLAVKRLTVADLPTQVSLSDSDAMMPELKLSAFDQVQLVARISRAGDAKSGEWIGQGEPLANTTQAVQRLIIDSADGKQP
ncbi:c-type cytochrome biogenesis protein CcmI [Phytopseudomonas seleniipraecipitans]|uniref:Cytochrome c-type biogenesis protein CcmH n=1 Tax=Phytopseudomonas seleniipraecipitans TaxID=640205 RepID=A0A1G7IAQ4_9GAMM|nr:c-type cytochrome biogenesis protein CcmI [Pseudomonas seleniipraecipitans]SDF09817.1 cytochrome c-type biogenesis protein CcmH [Pseudomonas seleniipraecipitans]